MTMNCESCKHWQPLDFPDVDLHGKAVYFPEDDDAPDLSDRKWGECTMAYSPYDKGYEAKYGDHAPERSQRMTVWDASDYKASLTTRSDFGCVEYETLNGSE